MKKSAALLFRLRKSLSEIRAAYFSEKYTSIKEKNMIQDNVLKFGYGDIAVGFVANELTFRYFRPPQEVGSYVCPDKVEWLSEKIHINYNQIRSFSRLLRQASERKISVFEYAGYTFDFTNFNSRSFASISEKFKYVEKWVSMAFAC